MGAPPIPIQSTTMGMVGMDQPANPPTREAALARLVREGECTATKLASLLGVSVQVMRRHLRSLEEEGLVQASPAPEGPGRPSNHWRLTETGRAHFPDGSEHFALGLLQSLATSLPADTLQLLLHRQAIDKAEDYRRQIGDGPLPQRLTLWSNCAGARATWPNAGRIPTAKLPAAQLPTAASPWTGRWRLQGPGC